MADDTKTDLQEAALRAAQFITANRGRYQEQHDLRLSEVDRDIEILTVLNPQKKASIK